MGENKNKMPLNSVKERLEVLLLLEKEIYFFFSGISIKRYPETENEWPSIVIQLLPGGKLASIYVTSTGIKIIRGPNNTVEKYDLLFIDGDDFDKKEILQIITEGIPSLENNRKSVLSMILSVESEGG